MATGAYPVAASSDSKTTTSVTRPTDAYSVTTTTATSTTDHQPTAGGGHSLATFKDNITAQPTGVTKSSVGEGHSNSRPDQSNKSVYLYMYACTYIYYVMVVSLARVVCLICAPKG